MYVKPTSRKNSIHIIGEVAKKIEDIDEEGENFWIYANETDLFLESGSDFWHAAIKNDEVSDLEEMPEGYVKSVTPTEIYYTSNFYTEGDNAYYDVNVIENGKSRCLAKEVWKTMSRFTKMEQSWLTRIGIPMENMNFPFLIKKEIRQKLQMESRRRFGKRMEILCMTAA